MGRADKILNNVENAKVKVAWYKCSKLVQVLINKCKRYVKVVKAKANLWNNKTNALDVMVRKYFKDKQL
jgi:hypothetical protein